MYNIIGDVHGEYKTLMALLKKMPDYQPLFLGDMIDRGPDSKKVLDFAMKHGKAVLGNHEHMMIDAYRKGGYYQNSLWVLWVEVRDLQPNRPENRVSWEQNC